MNRRKIVPLVCTVLVGASALFSPTLPGLKTPVARAAADTVFDFEDGTAQGWTKGNGDKFGAGEPVAYSNDLARSGNQGALKVNVAFAGGGWDEAGAMVQIANGDLSGYGSVEYDVYAPVENFNGDFKVGTIINWPWKELNDLETIQVSTYDKTETINGKTYAKIHKTVQLPASVADEKQPQLFIRTAASGSTYTGPVYIDDVVLKEGTTPPPAPPTADFEGTIYEAEAGTLTGTQVETSVPGYSGTGYVAGMDNPGDAMEFTVTVPAAGTYPLAIRYAGIYGYKEQAVAVNGVSVGNIKFPASDTWNTVVAGNVIMNAGENKVTITNSWGWMPVDYIKVGRPAERPALSPVPATLVNPNASVEARALMTYLTANYGKSIIAGQHQGQRGDVDYIYSLTGKLPVLQGFDMGDTGAEAKAKAVDDALAWANYGGIVELSWHWRAPMNGNEFYTTGTTFDITKAVTPGTAEYDAALKDIDAIAAQLQRLSDAKVPVLFRPLHEAQGGWFWWGAKGPEPLKQMWVMLYDRLTNYHHLNNLIWVFTHETGAESPNWYPGDQYVDIVGVDRYPSAGDYGPHMADFDKLAAQFDGKKLLTLSENGPIPSPDLEQNFKVGWSYFMTWSGNFVLDGKQNSEQHLIDVYNHGYVVTLDEFPSAQVYGRAPAPAPARKPLPTPAPVPAGYTVYQAEDAKLTGTTVDSSTKGYLGTGYVSDFTDEKDSVAFTVNAPNYGVYHVYVRQAAPLGDKKTNVLVNGQLLGEIALPQATTFSDANAGYATLNEGANTVTIERGWGYFDIDALLVRPVTVASLRAQVDAYVQSGDLKGALVAQLTNSLTQTSKFFSEGFTKQAATHLSDFVKHLDNATVSAAAKASLAADANALIGAWTR